MAALDRRPLILIIVLAAAVAVGVALVATGPDAARDEAGPTSAGVVGQAGSSTAPGAPSVPGPGGSSGAVTGREAAIAPDADAPAGDAAAASGVSGDAASVPIPIPLEFIEIFERNGSLAEFHAMLESETRDAAWALALEQFIQNQLDSSLDLSEFRVMSIECRSSRCEVLGMGYGENAVRGWMEGMFGLVEDEDAIEALIGGPGNMGCGFDDIAPGVTALHCTLQRTDPASDEPAPEEWFSLDAPYPDDAIVERVGVSETVVPALESDSSAYDLHRRLELESTDYAWANFIEPQLAEYMGQLGPERGVELLGVVCRETLCELQLKLRDDSAELDLMPHIIDFHRLDWHQLATADMSRAEGEEGEPIGVVWFLERVPGD